MSRRVLVTGAGSGLGKALASRFAAGGDRVLITDVDPVAGAAVAESLGQPYLPLDVTQDKSWQAAYEWCEREWDGLDVLVNNAGVGAGGRIERIPMSDWDWIIEINLKGVVRGCRTFIPGFKAQGSGHIVNVASLAAVMKLPAMSSYNVTKAGVLALSETLRYELEPYGIGTTVVCPAFFPTNLNDRLRSPDKAAAELSVKLMESTTLTAEQVANQVYDAVAQRRFLVLSRGEAARAARLKRFLPRVVDAQVRKYWARLRPHIDRE
ncbi:MAG: SDR family oxidoreductase [Micromonosporaceae bacterium]